MKNKHLERTNKRFNRKQVFRNKSTEKFYAGPRFVLFHHCHSNCNQSGLKKATHFPSIFLFVHLIGMETRQPDKMECPKKEQRKNKKKTEKEI